MPFDIIDTETYKQVFHFRCAPSSTILDVKKQIHGRFKKYYPQRQSLRLDPKGESLNDDDLVLSLRDQRLFFKDLGPQISWTTVFLCEYAGPLIIYLFFFVRPSLVYGDWDDTSVSDCTYFAIICWTVHYIKRIMETIFVHRFSHSVMPILNLFKNCGYYWTFTAYVAYHINHPLFTPPCPLQVYFGLLFFTLSELGNLSIHVALRNLRPSGTKDRKIPLATRNPFTYLFEMVSCPNYTYEAAAWIAFTLMTQCLPAGLFALAGFYQMTVWAFSKHSNYKKEFPKYPRSRTAIVPFLF